MTVYDDSSLHVAVSVFNYGKLKNYGCKNVFTLFNTVKLYIIHVEICTSTLLTEVNVSKVTFFFPKIQSNFISIEIAEYLMELF